MIQRPGRDEEVAKVETASGAWEGGVRDRPGARGRTALTEIYDQFGSYVFGLAARVIGDRHAAEDVTQEVFLSIWERPEAFEPRGARRRPPAAPPGAPARVGARSMSFAARRRGAGERPAMRRRWCRFPTSASWR